MANSRQDGRKPKRLKRRKMVLIKCLYSGTLLVLCLCAFVQQAKCQSDTGLSANGMSQDISATDDRRRRLQVEQWEQQRILGNYNSGHRDYDDRDADGFNGPDCSDHEDGAYIPGCRQPPPPDAAFDGEPGSQFPPPFAGEELGSAGDVASISAENWGPKTVDFIVRIAIMKPTVDVNENGLKPLYDEEEERGVDGEDGATTFDPERNAMYTSRAGEGNVNNNNNNYGGISQSGGATNSETSSVMTYDQERGQDEPSSGLRAAFVGARAKRLVKRTMTDILTWNTPFRAFKRSHPPIFPPGSQFDSSANNDYNGRRMQIDREEKEGESGERQFHWFMSQQDKIAGETLFADNRTPELMDDDREQQQRRAQGGGGYGGSGGGSGSWNQRNDNVNGGGGGGSNRDEHEYEGDSDDDDGRQRIHLFHNDTVVSFFSESTKVDPDTGKNVSMLWFQFQVFYVPFWKDGGPVMSEGHVRNIEKDGAAAVDYSVSNGSFLKLLRKYYQESLEEDGDEEVGDDLQAGFPTVDEDGVEGTPQTGTDDEYSDVLLIGVEFAGTEFLNTKESKRHDVTYPDNLATDDGLGVREIFGIGLFVAIVTISSLLSASALCLRRRRSEKHTWGVQYLTEQGVGELLQIGWRYETTAGLASTVATSSQVGGDGLTSNGGAGNGSHLTSKGGKMGAKGRVVVAGDSGKTKMVKKYGSAAANAATNGSGGQQVFLQVYDKSRLGYNDDNSMLMGGIEKLVPEVTATTVHSSTNSTATPGQSSYQSG